MTGLDRYLPCALLLIAVVAVWMLRATGLISTTASDTAAGVLLVLALVAGGWAWWANRRTHADPAEHLDGPDGP